MDRGDFQDTSTIIIVQSPPQMVQRLGLQIRTFDQSDPEDVCRTGVGENLLAEFLILGGGGVPVLRLPS